MENQNAMQWFTKADFNKYSHGDYVAIVGKTVVSSGRDPKVVFNQAKKLYPSQEIIMWKIPKKEMMVL